MTSKCKPGDKVWVKAEVLEKVRTTLPNVPVQIVDAVGPVGVLMHPKDIRPRVKRKAVLTAWQPIETAPKDGTRVLVSFRRCIFIDESRNRVRVCEAHYDFDLGWIQASGRELEGPEEPTHWQPLPEPPQ